jgi:hypothetical protein
MLVGYGFDKQCPTPGIYGFSVCENKRFVGARSTAEEQTPDIRVLQQRVA